MLLTILMWYLLGYMLAYGICRLSSQFETKEIKWTISDRVLALKLSLLSYILVVIGIIAFIVMALKPLKVWYEANKDKPATW